MDWISISSEMKPAPNQIVLVSAKDNLDGVQKAFLAYYTYYKAAGKIQHVWTCVGDMLMFDSSSVTYWAQRPVVPQHYRWSI